LLKFDQQKIHKKTCSKVLHCCNLVLSLLQ